MSPNKLQQPPASWSLLTCSLIIHTCTIVKLIIGFWRTGALELSVSRRQTLSCQSHQGKRQLWFIIISTAAFNWHRLVGSGHQAQSVACQRVAAASRINWKALLFVSPLSSVGCLLVSEEMSNAILQYEKRQLKNLDLLFWLWILTAVFSCEVFAKIIWFFQKIKLKSIKYSCIFQVFQLNGVKCIRHNSHQAITKDWIYTALF